MIIIKLMEIPCINKVILSLNIRHCKLVDPFSTRLVHGVNCHLRPPGARDCVSKTPARK